MRHQKAGLKLNRTSSHRKAMFRNMVTSLFKYERIRTTEAKAKELRSWADHLITLAKRGDLHAMRQALAIVREKPVVYKLFEEAPKRFGTVAGGYTRVVKLGRRQGDAALLCLIELIEAKAPKKKSAAPKKPKQKDAAAAAKPTKKDVSAKKAPEKAAEAAEKPAAKKPEAPAKPKTAKKAETAPVEKDKKTTPKAAKTPAKAKPAAKKTAKSEDAPKKTMKTAAKKPTKTED